MSDLIVAKMLLKMVWNLMRWFFCNSYFDNFYSLLTHVIVMLCAWKGESTFAMLKHQNYANQNCFRSSETHFEKPNGMPISEIASNSLWWLSGDNHEKKWLAGSPKNVNNESTKY